jgi:putative PEP-CTERM system TPR-repeat lipoprotein
LTAATLCAVLVTACSEESPEKVLASAQSFLSKRDLNAATIQLKTVLQKQPNNASARYLLGTTLMEQGDVESAEKELRKAVELEYSGKDPKVLIARSLRLQGKAKELLKEFQGAALDQTSDQADLLVEIGYAFMGVGAMKDARNAFMKASDLAPNGARPKTGQAILALGDRDPAKASTLIDEALVESPDMVDALLVKAQLQSATSDEAAIQTYQKLQSLVPWHPLVASNLVHLQVKRKDFAAARQSLERFRRASPRDPRGMYLLSLVAYREGKLDEAREAILQTLKSASDSPSALLLAGAIEFDSRKYGSAAEHLKRASELSPGDPRPRLMYATALLRGGHAARASDALAPLLRNDLQNATVLTVAGEIALAQGEPEEARAYFEKASKSSGKNTPGVRAGLARAKMASGDFDSSVKELESLSAAYESDTQADLALISAYLSKRKYAEALGAIEALNRKIPKSALTEYLTGIAFAGKGDTGAARRHFEDALSLQFDHIPSATALAQMDIAEERSDSAKQRFQDIVNKAPNNAQAWLGLARVLGLSRAPRAEIQETLERAVRADPVSPQARLALGAFHLSGDDRKKLLEATTEAAASLPGNADVLEQLGLAQQISGDVNQAVITFNKMIAAAPTSARPHVRLAQLHLVGKNTGAAISALNKALSLEPDSAPAVELLVSTLSSQNKADAAVQVVRRYQKSAPSSAKPWILEGRLMLASQKWSEAEAAFRKAHSIRPSAETVIWTHQSMLLSGQGTKARDFADVWIVAHPNDVIVLRYMADGELQAKAYGAAKDLYLKALRLQPNDPLLLNNLAWTLHNLHDTKALEYAERAAAKRPNDPAILDTLGTMQIASGDHKAGLDTLKKAVTLGPKIPAVRLGYAKGLLATGDKEGAKSELEAVLRLEGSTQAKREAEKLLATL